MISLLSCTSSQRIRVRLRRTHPCDVFRRGRIRVRGAEAQEYETMKRC